MTPSPPPRVSIIMATFNVAPFIAEAVQSALNQSFPDFELIVVDDGSTDGTPGIVAQFRDPRIRLHRLPHNGAPATLNHGMAAARGQFLSLLDGDDRWHPEKLEKHLAFLDANPQVDISFSWSRIIDETGVDTGNRARPWIGPISFSELLVDNVIANGSAVVFRASAYLAAGEFDTTFGGCYDLDVWLRIARLRPANICAIPEELTDYRRRGGQLTKQTRVMEDSWLRLIEKMRALEPDLVRTAAPLSCVNLYRFLSFVNFERNDRAEALRCLRLSFSHHPFAFASDFRNWGLLAILGSGLVMPRSWHQAFIRTAIRLAARLRPAPAA